MTSSKTSRVDGRSATATDGQAGYLDYDVWQLIQDLYHSKQEIDIARQQFDSVVDPILIDHIIFRIGAAEQRFNFLIQTARRMKVHLDGFRWDLIQSR